MGGGGGGGGGLSLLVLCTKHLLAGQGAGNIYEEWFWRNLAAFVIIWKSKQAREKVDSSQLFCGAGLQRHSAITPTDHGAFMQRHHMKGGLGG